MHVDLIWAYATRVAMCGEMHASPLEWVEGYRVSPPPQVRLHPSEAPTTRLCLPPPAPSPSVSARNTNAFPDEAIAAAKALEDSTVAAPLGDVATS